jgi:FemAB-related protein (PEP-CTERM system-associated)
LRDADQAAWDSYVAAAPDGLPTHLAGWRQVLGGRGGYEMRFTLARRDGQMAGALPLFFVRSALVGHTAMTMPGGLCADDPEVAGALLAYGRARAWEAGMQRFVLQDSRLAWPAEGLETTADHVQWTVELRAGPEELWRGLHRNIRRQVRIAESSNLRIEIDRSGARLRDFYQVFGQFAHRSGTPVFGLDFLQRVVAAFPDSFHIAVVRHESEPIGAFFQLELADAVHGMWGATLHEYLRLRPNYLAYWELMKYASERGFAYLDMGRSRSNSGASDFKGQWGGDCRPIYQQVAARDRAGGADSVTQRIGSGGPMQWVTRMWPKLPLSVASYLGPKLRRHVPFA